MCKLALINDHIETMRVVPQKRGFQKIFYDENAKKQVSYLQNLHGNAAKNRQNQKTKKLTTGTDIKNEMSLSHSQKLLLCKICQNSKILKIPKVCLSKG